MLSIYPSLCTTQDARHAKNALQLGTKRHYGFEILSVIQPCDNY